MDFKKIISEMEELVGEISRDMGGLFQRPFDDDAFNSYTGISVTPYMKDFLNLEIEIMSSEGGEPLDSGDEESEPEESEETEVNKYEEEEWKRKQVYRIPKTPKFINVYHGGVEIRRVPKYFLGHNVLGRAFPGLGLIEIADDLYGSDFDEVRMHEMLHMENPNLPESEIRAKTRDSLPFETRWN